MTAVSFGGLTIDEGFETGFHLSRLVGWDDAAPVRNESEPRPAGHGSFRPGKLFRGARVVSVEGSWSGETLEEAYAARRALAAVQSDGVESEFAVTDLLGETWVTAGLANAPTMDDQLFSPFFTFAFDVLAVDPFRYGAWVTSSSGVPTASTGLTWPLLSAPSGLFWDWGTDGVTGRVGVNNTGTADTYSTFEVTGGLSGGFLLTWVPTGAEIRFDRQILPGSTVALDPRTGRATIDGQSDVSGYLTRASWWPVGAGESGDVQFTPLGVVTGTPTLTVRTASAFL